MIGVKLMVSKRIVVGVEDRAVLERIVRSRRAERRMVERAGVVLAAAEGLSAKKIAVRVGCSAKLPGRWRARYEREGMDGLRDLARSGRPLIHDAGTRALLIANAHPPAGHGGRSASS
ncbi:MAG: helix-turn-helix domain-containing protein [Solirubrobacteraceae bacterium]